jgi:DNA-directed RNA polymerase specialized sigma24 family protein
MGMAIPPDAILSDLPCDETRNPHAATPWPHNPGLPGSHEGRRGKGLKEGKEKERQRSWQEKRQAILKLAARQMPAADIADVLGLDVKLVRKTLANGS